MAKLIGSPTPLSAPGSHAKNVEEYVGLMNTGDGAISIARTRCPGGWKEPAKCPRFDEFAIDDIERAIRSVAVGRPFFSPSIAQALLEDYVRLTRERRTRDLYDLLTEREREVLQLLAEGKYNKEAATILGLSTYTIETHRQNLMQKLGLHNTAEIVLYAVRKAIIAG